MRNLFFTFLAMLLVSCAGYDDSRPPGNPTQWSMDASDRYCNGGPGDTALVPGTKSTFARADIDCYVAFSVHNIGPGSMPNNSGRGEEDH